VIDLATTSQRRQRLWPGESGRAEYSVFPTIEG
jgi:hypothetical protein